MTLSVPLPKTPDGRVYRYSPNETAYPRHFLLGDEVAEPSTDEIHISRMKQPPRSPNTTCPYSGTVAEDAAFTHPDDVAAAKELIGYEAQKDISTFLDDMVSQFNRRQGKGGLINISMSTESTSRIRPRFYRRDLMRELVCDHCNRDYAVFALSIYCPDCGAPNVHLHFSRERDLVKQQVEVAESLDAQDELAYRLLGNAHEDILTAFEATLRMIYMHRKQIDKPNQELPQVGNAFQNIERTRKLFAEWDFDPFAVLDEAAMKTLRIDIQKRHVIGHNLGVIDTKFLDHATEAKLGETVALVAQDVNRFAETCYTVVQNVDSWLAGMPSPPTREPDEEEELRVIDVNDTQKLSAEIGLTEEAINIAKFLIESSENGIPDSMAEKTLTEKFPDVESQTLNEALAELEIDGFIEVVRGLGQGISAIHMELELFASFDPIFTENDPHADAATLASLLLEQENAGNVEQLHEISGWALRRFNPALAILSQEIDDRRVSKTDHGKYPIRNFVLTDIDRVKLRRLVSRSSD